MPLLRRREPRVEQNPLFNCEEPRLLLQQTPLSIAENPACGWRFLDLRLQRSLSSSPFFVVFCCVRCCGSAVQAKCFPFFLCIFFASSVVQKSRISVGTCGRDQKFNFQWGGGAFHLCCSSAHLRGVRRFLFRCTFFCSCHRVSRFLSTCPFLSLGLISLVLEPFSFFVFPILYK